MMQPHHQFQHHLPAHILANQHGAPPAAPITPATPCFPTATPGTPGGPHTPGQPMAASTLAAQPPVLPIGHIMLGRWRITGKLGQGAFGQTLAAEDVAGQSVRRVAIKFETGTAAKQVLKLEVSILKRLDGCPYAAALYDSGAIEIGNPPALQTYMVMELLGTNLSDLRKNQPGNRFSPATTALLGRQMIDALRWVHEIGYLHRDVKPSNFVMGLDKHPDHRGVLRPKCFIIDFGLSRRYRNPEGGVREARQQAGFRGTARYASLNAHESKELSRRDDFWSVYYLLVEFLVGALPWRKEKDRDAVYRIKKQMTAPSLVNEAPAPVRHAMNEYYHHVRGLQYAQPPNYDYLMQIMDGMFDETTRGTDPKDVLYDWELLAPSSNGGQGPYIVSPATPVGATFANASGVRSTPQHPASGQMRQHSHQQPFVLGPAPPGKFRTMPSRVRPPSPHPIYARAQTAAAEGDEEEDEDEFGAGGSADEHRPLGETLGRRSPIPPNYVHHYQTPANTTNASTPAATVPRRAIAPSSAAPVIPARPSTTLGRNGSSNTDPLNAAMAKLRIGSASGARSPPITSDSAPVGSPASSKERLQSGSSSNAGGGMFSKLTRAMRGLPDRLMHRSPAKSSSSSATQGLSINGRAAPVISASPTTPTATPAPPAPTATVGLNSASTLEAMHAAYDSKYTLAHDHPGSHDADVIYGVKQLDAHLARRPGSAAPRFASSGSVPSSLATPEAIARPKSAIARRFEGRR